MLAGHIKNSRPPPTYTVIELIENYILTLYRSPIMTPKRDISSFSILILGVYAACNVLGLEKKSDFPLKLWCLIFQSSTSLSC